MQPKVFYYSRNFLLAVLICPTLFLLTSLAKAQNQIQTSHTSIKILKRQNFTPKTDSILQKAVFLIDSIVNTAGFRNAVLAAQFVNTKGCTNEEIRFLFLKGHEVFKPFDNDTLEFELSVYPDQNGDNIGTTYHSKRIETSEKFILKNGAKCYAAHLIHEYCHTIGYDGLGFAHIHNTSNGRKQEKCSSVPYVMGEIARRLLNSKTCHFECEN